MFRFAGALIALVIAIQVAWAMIAPIIGYVVLVTAWFIVPRLVRAFGASQKFGP